MTRRVGLSRRRKGFAEAALQRPVQRFTQVQLPYFLDDDVPCFHCGQCWIQF